MANISKYQSQGSKIRKKILTLVFSLYLYSSSTTLHIPNPNIHNLFSVQIPRLITRNFCVLLLLKHTWLSTGKWFIYAITKKPKSYLQIVPDPCANIVFQHYRMSKSNLKFLYYIWYPHAKRGKIQETKIQKKYRNKEESKMQHNINSQKGCSGQRSNVVLTIKG